MDDVRIGLVLGAGGVAGGFYLRAAMAEIERVTRWSPSSAVTVIGTSVGALNAARLPVPDQDQRADEDQLAALAAIAHQMGELSSSTLSLAVVALRRFGGELVSRLGPVGRHRADYEVAAPPYHPGVHTVSVVADGFIGRTSGARRVVRLADAPEPEAELYASAAVPGFALPIDVAGERRIDGAVFSSTNADLVAVEEHDALVVIAPMVARHGGSPLARSHRALLHAELRPWRAASKPVVVVAPTGHEQTLRADHQRFAAAAVARVREAVAQDRDPQG